MKLPTNNVQSTYGARPHIRKGYYPGQLIGWKFDTDADGKPKDKLYGRQIIMEFAIYQPDNETGAPIKTVMFKPDEKANEIPVTLSTFIYYQYKDKKTGELRTAITPNAAITSALKALGWAFSADGVDIDALIGSWADLNINDYDHKNKEGQVTVESTIASINPYKGPKPTVTSVGSKPAEPTTIKAQIKHDAVVEDSPKVTEIKAKIAKLDKMKTEGLLSEDAYNMSLEQLETQLEEAKKK